MTDAEQEDFERRLAGLENMAIDAIGSARKCITDALHRHEERLVGLNMRLEDLELINKEALSRVREYNADPSLDP